MDHPFLAALSAQLGDRGVATLRFQFPYMERKSRRPDAPGIAQAAVHAALEAARAQWPTLPLFAGGKSFGGRMTTQLQARQPWAGLRGIVLLGFPLHPAGKRSTQRAGHLAQVDCPMLFLQGTRDALADLPLIRHVTGPLRDAELHVVDGADHSFHVLARSGRRDDEVLAELADTAARWMHERMGERIEAQQR